jgi:Lsr2
MAQRINVTMTCDLDHVPGEPLDARTRRFSLDGQDYEIDVCSGHEAQLDDMVAGYAEAARKTTAQPAHRSRPVAHREFLAAVRKWARSPDGQQALGGATIGDRGRIPAEAVARYRELHPTDQ